MSKIVVGPINKALRTDVTAFNIDNDAFPYLVNAYQWRGRIKRKRGTAKLGRLQRYISGNDGNTGGAGNFFRNLRTDFGLEANSSIVPGSFTAVCGGNTYTETSPPSGNLLVNGSPAPAGSYIYYNTTDVAIIGGPINTLVTVTFLYYPDLPVLGLEDYFSASEELADTLAFDTKYSYFVDAHFPYNISDVSYYKNPPTSGGYTQKTTWTPTTWNGQTYQQFWSTNYQGAFWTTNGIDIPFTGANIGLPAKAITNVVAVVAVGPPAQIRLTVPTHGLSIGDWVFLNEFNGLTGINFQTGYVIAVPGGNTIIVELPNATLGGAWTTGGIVQYLTNRPDSTKDCLRWYDGAPTNLNPNPPTFQTGYGWVNFCPPLSQDIYSIADLPAQQYYLVGARMIVPFKDRLLFVGPVVQSSTGTPQYLQDVVIYSQNGTPYYTCSFTLSANQSITGADVVFNPLLTPGSISITGPFIQTATACSFFEDSAGFGGFATSALNQPITSVSSNEDVLIMGHSGVQTRFVYTGNDIVPFTFYLVNSELGTNSTFTTINLDQGVISKGTRGFIITSQTGAARIDLEIPQAIFDILNNSNGAERATGIRDFINEWIYFTYCPTNTTVVYPSQTLQYNYRDVSWAIFNESYTTYGTFRKKSGLTWATVGTIFSSWSVWSQPWNWGSTNVSQPVIIGGNQQGFIMLRDQGTSEGESLYIQDIVGSVVTSPAHGLSDGDYIMINNAVGAMASQVNGLIFSVSSPTADTFTLNPSITGGTYQGLGTITRMYVPYIQTKQFPVAWDISRKVRLGPQQYLFSTTTNAQVQLLIFLSQNNDIPYNDSIIEPNQSLIYSTVLYTCPESTNLGLTPFNANLQTPTAAQQSQLWHRKNTSLIGDTVQIGITLSDAQMRAVDSNGKPISQFAEIELHAFILDVNPSQLLV